jgi:outer membrane protein assembly factor BamB
MLYGAGLVPDACIRLNFQAMICRFPSWFILVSIAWILSGCANSAEEDVTELPDVEPVNADLVDSVAVEAYRQKQAFRPNTAREEHLPAGNDWPQLFGSDRTSSRRGLGLDLAWGDQGPTELWSVEVGSGYGSPVVSENRVVFNHRVDDLEIVQCVAADTGTTLWTHESPTTFVCDYEYSSGPLSTPMIHQGRVYAAGGQGQFYCLDLGTGELIWDRDLRSEYDLQDDLFAMGSTPLLVGKHLIFNVGAVDHQAGIIAMDAEDGTTVWEATDHGAAYCSPFATQIEGEPYVFVITAVGLVSLHPETGEVDWVIEHRSRAPMSFNSVSPLAHRNQVIAITGPGPGAVCVEVLPDRTYRKAWRDRRVLDSQYNTLMLANGKLYGFTAAGQGGAELRCVDFETGDLIWKYHSILRRGQGLVVGDAILVLGERGHLAAISRAQDDPEVIAFTSEPLMSEPCYCTPAIAGTRLFLKDEERVACFDLAAAKD